MKNYCVLETVELVGVGPNGESAYPVRDFFRGSFTSFNEIYEFFKALSKYITADVKEQQFEVTVEVCPDDEITFKHKTDDSVPSEVVVRFSIKPSEDNEILKSGNKLPTKQHISYRISVRDSEDDKYINKVGIFVSNYNPIDRTILNSTNNPEEYKELKNLLSNLIEE